MTKIWAAILVWVASKGGWAHALVLCGIALIGAYAAVPAFANLVNTMYAVTPPWFHMLALAALGIFMTYFNPVNSKKG